MKSHAGRGDKAYDGGDPEASLRVDGEDLQSPLKSFWGRVNASSLSISVLCSDDSVWSLDIPLGLQEDNSPKAWGRVTSNTSKLPHSLLGPGRGEAEDHPPWGWRAHSYVAMHTCPM